MGEFVARMQVLGGEPTDLGCKTGRSGEAQISIPGFGVMFVGLLQSEAHDRLGDGS